MTEPDSTTTTGQPPIQRRARLTGFPGENQGIIAVFHYIDTGKKAHLNAHGPAGLPGMYTVEFVLAKPDVRNAPENEFCFADQRRGDSHLAIAEPAVTSLRYAARQRMKNDFETFVRYLGENGVVVSDLDE
jgi:hypothetical protein